MVFFVLLLWYAGFTHEHSANDDMSAYSGGRAALEAADAPPTVLFFLMDDLGWNDIGYQSSDIALASPAMTAAARAGVTLAWYYTYPECTPSRSSLLTGQYASTVGMQHDCITTCDPFGVPSTFSLLPEVLKQQQPLYTTAMVGKWDLGLAPGDATTLVLDGVRVDVTVVGIYREASNLGRLLMGFFAHFGPTISLIVILNSSFPGCCGGIDGSHP